MNRHIPGMEVLARDLLDQAVRQYGPSLSNMGQTVVTGPELAIVILSPQGLIRLLGGDGVPTVPSSLVEVGDFALTGTFIQPYVASTTYPVDHLMDVKGAFLDLIVVDSSCNAVLTIQTIGHTIDSPGDTNGRVNLGGAQSMADGSTTTQRLGIAVVRRDYPYPYLGVTVASGGTPPTTGRVQVNGYYERWPRALGGPV